MPETNYILLNRSTLQNEVFLHDPTAWRIFETLLLLADRKTGSWSGGREQLANITGFKGVTVYSALRRLKVRSMLVWSSNNKNSVFSICNWGKYQASSNSASNNQVTTKQHSNNIEEVISTTNVVLTRARALDRAMEDFKQHRKALRRPMTDRAVALMGKRLETLAGSDPEKKLKLIETAIEHGWMSVYELRDDAVTKNVGGF